MGNLFLQELNKYESSIEEVDKKATYAIVTKKIFYGETNENELAVLALISLFSHNEAIDNKIKTRAFHINQIYDSLAIETKDKKKYITKFENILHNLLHKKVLSTYKETKNDRYYTNQEVTETGFFQIGIDEIEKIIESDEKVAMKIKMIADYLTICSGVWSTKNYSDSKKFVNYMSLNTIAKMRSSEVRSVSQSIKKLIEVKAIATYKVRFNDSIETKYVFARFNHRSILKAYVSKMIAENKYRLVVNSKVVEDEDFKNEILGSQTVTEPKIQAITDDLEDDERELISVAEVAKTNQQSDLKDIRDYLKVYLNCKNLPSSKKLDQLISENEVDVLVNSFREMIANESSFLDDLKNKNDLGYMLNIIVKSLSEKYLWKVKNNKEKQDIANRILEKDMEELNKQQTIIEYKFTTESEQAKNAEKVRVLEDVSFEEDEETEDLDDWMFE